MTQEARGRDIDDVRRFWEANPLFAGESQYEVGSKEFFEEHRRVVIEDCLAGNQDERLFPPEENRDRVLDLGCGCGFWTVELARGGCTGIVAVDLTEKAVELTRKRCQICGVEAHVCRADAENLAFEDASFRHVNCQGVIHHTPDTEACVQEIARVLKDGGTAIISVYYRNLFLAAWPVLRYAGRALARWGLGLRGRGRESILRAEDAREVVRMYDGADNPIGKCYCRRDFLELLRPYFHVEELFFHLFPARAFPFRLPRVLHRFLDRHFGFMIYSKLRKA